jgi:ribosomal protein L37AE/L43A
MASSDDEGNRHCPSDLSKDNDWVRPRVSYDGQQVISARARPVAQTDEEGVRVQLDGQEAFSAPAQPAAQTTEISDSCPQCNGDQVMIGRNQHGTWKKCRIPSCKHKWAFVRVTSKHATTSSSTSCVVTHPWRGICRWLMTRARSMCWDGDSSEDQGWWCSDCNMWLNGPTQQTAHMIGKKHRQSLTLKKRAGCEHAQHEE